MADQAGRLRGAVRRAAPTGAATVRSCEISRFAGETACATTGKSFACISGAGCGLPKPACGHPVSQHLREWLPRLSREIDRTVKHPPGECPGAGPCYDRGLSGLGLRATDGCKPRQVRKEATVVVRFVCRGLPGAWQNCPRGIRIPTPCTR